MLSEREEKQRKVSRDARDGFCYPEKEEREKGREGGQEQLRQGKKSVDRTDPRGRNVGISGLTISVKVVYIVFLRIGKPVLVPLLLLENDERRASPTRFSLYSHLFRQKIVSKIILLPSNLSSAKMRIDVCRNIDSSKGTRKIKLKDYFIRSTRMRRTFEETIVSQRNE